jgi:hypothetical protein
MPGGSGSWCQLYQKRKQGAVKKTPRDSGTFPESQRLSEFRLLAGATMAPISGDYKTVKMVKDAAPGLFTGDLKRVWDKLKIGSRLNESRLKPPQKIFSV